MKLLTEIGEYEIVNWLRRIIPNAPNIAFPIGSDCAGLKIPENVDLLINTDGVSSTLLKNDTANDGRYVGRFCVTHVLSDIVCMGGWPVAFLPNLHMTRHTSFEYLQALVEEMQSCLETYNTYTIGGDIKETNSRAVVGVGIGFVEKGRALTRAGAKPGNLLAVTLKDGLPLGLRWAHEIAQQYDLESTRVVRKELAAARFEYLKLPLKEMRAAHRTGTLTSAMDTSDGILACVQHIEAMSKVGFVLFEESLLSIIDKRILPIAKELSINPVNFAFNAGYDWETVCTIERSYEAEAQSAVRDVGGALAIIGEATNSPQVTKIKTLAGQLLPLQIFADEKFMPVSRQDPVKTWLEMQFFSP
jgi:thiamine-monophosphate kinase